ncbi:TetR/AcrR family transcriptional regulator [Caballeronia sp. LZ062]|uniref:TetR/AcrR family transcriptional regulator n=1 Tax=unclassified Caballeronia TaxID=2646786 RepID=UPI00285554D2|nr:MULTISPECIES: TetR/AcrR family transcriptional regulator [unclassified Caballeronia]MDR5856127.1 TetR/AcrR family transcriptional regulator [Caballeronia sp. LZ050]MDR5872798.1 TetR/AcrR family transcriptional regulator [Caballeronia sp. LZ062]
MPRPREFDEEAALDAATAQFWSRGYEATSVRDLAATMGLTAASLYNAFGDKRALFERALNRYVEYGFRDRVRRFEHHLPPRDAIVAFFEEIIELSVRDPHRKGCLIVNTALELAPHDRQIHRALSGVLKEMEGFFLRCVLAGQHDGTIAATVPAEDTAKALLASLMGLRVLARVNPRRELLEGAARPVLAMLGADKRGSKARPKN